MSQSVWVVLRFSVSCSELSQRTTKSPSLSPSQTPTISPTKKPTTSPTASPTASPSPPTPRPTRAPTQLHASFYNLQDLMVPVFTFYECGGLTSSQAHDFADSVYGAKNAAKAFHIIGIISWIIFIIWMTLTCYLYGKYRGNIRVCAGENDDLDDIDIGDLDLDLDDDNIDFGFDTPVDDNNQNDNNNDDMMN